MFFWNMDAYALRCLGFGTVTCLTDVTPGKSDMCAHASATPPWGIQPGTGGWQGRGRRVTECTSETEPLKKVHNSGM